MRICTPGIHRIDKAKFSGQTLQHCLQDQVNIYRLFILLLNHLGSKKSNCRCHRELYSLHRNMNDSGGFPGSLQEVSHPFTKRSNDNGIKQQMKQSLSPFGQRTAMIDANLNDQHRCNIQKDDRCIISLHCALHSFSLQFCKTHYRSSTIPKIYQTLEETGIYLFF